MSTLPTSIIIQDVMCIHLGSGCEKGLEVDAEGEVGMDCESSQELVQSSLPLLQKRLTHVVKIPAHLFAWQWLAEMKQGGRGGKERIEGEGRGVRKRT